MSTVTETISVVASVASVALAIVAIRDNRLRNPLPQPPGSPATPPAGPTAPPSWPAAPPPPQPSRLGTNWVAVAAGIVAVLAYSALLANTIDGDATARVVVSVATLAVVVVIWLARRLSAPNQPSPFLNWLMIVLAVGAIGALPLPWTA